MRPERRTRRRSGDDDRRPDGEDLPKPSHRRCRPSRRPRPTRHRPAVDQPRARSRLPPPRPGRSCRSSRSMPQRSRFAIAVVKRNAAVRKTSANTTPDERPTPPLISSPRAAASVLPPAGKCPARMAAFDTQWPERGNRLEVPDHISPPCAALRGVKRCCLRSPEYGSTCRIMR